MTRRSIWTVTLIWSTAMLPPVRADQFEQLDGPMLVKLVKGSDVQLKTSMTVADLAAMPAMLRDSPSALILASSDLGNPARLLIIPELRKPASGKGEPFPVLFVERLDSFDSADASTRMASRRAVVLFDGFQFDLDTGQVVPEGQGGDMVFRSSGEPGPRLESIGSAKLFTLIKPPAFDNSKAPQPTPGRAVLPSDFAGRYRLYANGQWSGTLELKVGTRGSVTGKFRSDLHGTSYAVTGQVAMDNPQKLEFAVSFPRARQEFEGYLWGEGKGAMAGKGLLLDRPFGFFAVREGGRYAPEGRDLGPLVGPDDDRPGRHVVRVKGLEVWLDGKATTIEATVAALRAGGDPEDGVPAWVLIEARPDQKFRDLMKVVEAVREAGITIIRFAEWDHEE